MENILNKISELHITADSEYGFHVTYRVSYPFFTKSFYTDFDKIDKVLEILKEDIEEKIRNISI